MPQTQTANGRQHRSALDRLRASIDAAGIALKDLRSETTRNSRDLFKDIDKTMRHTQRNVRRSRRTLLRDLERIPRAITQDQTVQPGARGTGARRPSTTRSGARPSNSSKQAETPAKTP